MTRVMSYMVLATTALTRLSAATAFKAPAAPTADADDADALAIDVGLQADEVHRRAEILGVDVRRGDVARLAAAFPGVGADRRPA
jgi:hypothetical protein